MPNQVLVLENILVIFDEGGPDRDRVKLIMAVDEFILLKGARDLAADGMSEGSISFGFLGPILSLGLLEKEDDLLLRGLCGYFQRVRAESAAVAGLHIATITGTFSVTSIVTGRIVGRYGTRRPILAGLALLSASAFGLSRLVGHAQFAAIGCTLALFGLGAGLVAPPMNAAILASATPSYSGIGSGVLNASRQIGTALGVAVFASFFHAAEPLAAVRLAMTSASGLYLAAFLVVALIRDERPARRVVENAPVIE